MYTCYHIYMSKVFVAGQLLRRLVLSGDPPPPPPDKNLLNLQRTHRTIPIKPFSHLYTFVPCFMHVYMEVS